jgi:predicted small lipoprotein YifL
VSRYRARLALLLLAVAVSGCGLKGALTLPPKSDEVVIRAPGQAAAAPAGEPVEGEAPATPAAPGTPAAPVAPVAPEDERIPPPPLPGSNARTTRGG